MTLPKDLREQAHGDAAQHREKVGFGTKIKNLLHLGGKKDVNDTTDTSMGTGTSGLNQNYGLN